MSVPPFPVSHPQTPSFKDIIALTKQLTGYHREFGITARYAKERRMEPHFEPEAGDLVKAGSTPEGHTIRLTRPAADAWSRMERAAAMQSITLVPISGFRTIERQAEIVREKLKAGGKIEDILRFVAAPGFSEHHTGRAIDIGSPEHIELDEEFEGTAAFRWLEQHAPAFGFRMSYPRDNPHGIGFEPWHWCWQP